MNSKYQKWFRRIARRREEAGKTTRRHRVKDWKLRNPKKNNIDPYDLYQLHDDFFTIKLFYKGEWWEDKGYFYKGGVWRYIDYCHREKMSMIEINDILKKLNQGDETIVYSYLEPTGTFKDGLKFVFNDEDLVQMCNWIPRFKVIEFYVEVRPIHEVMKIHEMYNPLVAPPKISSSTVVIKETEDEEPGLRTNVRGKVMKTSRSPGRPRKLKRKLRQCGICKAIGHNKATCRRRSKESEAALAQQSTQRRRGRRPKQSQSLQNAQECAPRRRGRRKELGRMMTRSRSRSRFGVDAAVGGGRGIKRKCRDDGRKRQQLEEKDGRKKRRKN